MAMDFISSRGKKLSFARYLELYIVYTLIYRTEKAFQNNMISNETERKGGEGTGRKAILIYQMYISRE